MIEATGAALTYLQYLNNYFGGDWFLAIAAYNGGEGTVSAARPSQPGTRACPRISSAWSCAPRRATTCRSCSPSAASCASPDAYGLQFAAIPNVPYFDVVEPGRQVHLGDAADLAGITRDDMFALNPGYNRMTTPPNGPHRLLLPIPNARPVPQGHAGPARCSKSRARRWSRRSNRRRRCVTASGAARP